MASDFLAMSYHTKSYVNIIPEFRNRKFRFRFFDKKPKSFFQFFPTEFCGIPESEAEIPIPDPPARGAVPAEFPTKKEALLLQYFLLPNETLRTPTCYKFCKNRFNIQFYSGRKMQSFLIQKPYVCRSDFERK